MDKVKSILVSQPQPEGEKNPYFDLAQKHNLKIDFRSFIHVEGVDVKDFRTQKVNILDHSAIILTSKNAADHFFRICEETRTTVPEGMKYFCVSEAIAYYLQKYVVYRKRKIFFGGNTFKDMADILKKHKSEKFLLPCIDDLKPSIPETLDSLGLNYTKAVIYKTVSSDLSDLADVNYDVLVFYSPSGIKSLFENFPDFKQNKTRIAAFGPTTTQAVKEHHLRLDIGAPVPNAPSMTMALDQYITMANKKK
ncbi:MAG: uroporphyrinogen-III synthase [Bacteroidetes bacterium]|nr:MAG: uroporphyrinogen-III synthase [Bacteroidota bacterium]